MYKIESEKSPITTKQTPTRKVLDIIFHKMLNMKIKAYSLVCI